MQQNPKVVSIELGANEVLGARSGIAIPGVTIYPTAEWIPLYDALVNTMVAKTQRVLLTGLIKDAGSFPSFRRGSEVFADAPTLLAAFHVMVSPDCDGSQNLIFVPVSIPTAISIGAYNRGRSLPPFVFSCADLGPGVPDYVLTPAEAAVVNGTLDAMTNHIRSTAARLGLAYFELDALYGMPGLKPPFSSIQLMTTAQPYGAYISLDGIHPNELGHAVLARAAARALNDQYRMRIPLSTAFVAAR
jgi:lysophospholipase L1-like esterase